MSVSLNGIKRAWTNIGSFLGRTNDASLIEVLGVPDVAGKDLYTCLVTDRLDDATFGLSPLQVLIAALQTDLDNGTDGLGALKGLIDALPQTMVGTDNAFLAAVGGALADVAAAGDPTEADTVMQYVKQLVNILIGTAGIEAWTGAAVPGAGVSIHEVIQQIYNDVTLVLADTGTAGVVLGTKAATYKTLAGENQIAFTTEELNQVAENYDLFLGTAKPVLLKALSIKQPTTVTAGALTSISIQTDDATPGVIISAVDGVVGNLLTESELSWTGAMRIETGTKIQLTIAGGATGVAQVCKIVVEYVAIEDTGSLVAQE